MRAHTLGGRTLPAALLAALAAGCGGAGAGATAVHGTVTYRGTPPQTGVIVFTPDPTRGGNGPQARADIRADGTYDLKADPGTEQGAGWYRITVAAVEPADPARGRYVPRSLLPDKY